MKKYLFASIALVIAIAMSSFTILRTDPDPLVYFKIVNGNYENVNAGLQGSNPFSCAGSGTTCSKGFDPARTLVVSYYSSAWHLLDTGASEDDIIYKTTPPPGH